ncbi:hypothetical protein F9C07_2225967 [Aspergillus flavus]|uniref:Uncharacterized protein n=3 Tax=Aspergillus subgen. Circumdati TaxID=2720871 RepID=B8N1Y8_ASPFN|nr:uncharacterized protein G4B84_003249 [Aspergillus flavus NRRL3357]KAB8247158.1 hypothetical protein BDV35DRAFT_392305 [Aspergillus flavus]OOO10402.1 hypothetical protein OAory_01062100 [Aspergillus oryzae]KAF7619535.1 hypothetical protein AFLA_001160 [Aspergillus flavus NRRL3357]KAJ1715907.1 hypothetical protein NYO67_1927 [Aspergillus flavus]QMW27960.1 hypothetical protein G4B84_003249 [Aspergillus flavus NRRL3357]
MSRGSLVPLIILVVIVTILAVIGYITYSIVQEVTRNTKSKMEKKNVLWTKDGMKVGVKEINNEDYQDRTQSVLVNMWNHTSFPAYKSRLWNMTQPAAEVQQAEKRKGYSK